jgi:hypothetical protein
MEKCLFESRMLQVIFLAFEGGYMLVCEPVRMKLNALSIVEDSTSTMTSL